MMAKARKRNIPVKSATPEEKRQIIARTIKKLAEHLGVKHVLQSGLVINPTARRRSLTLAIRAECGIKPLLLDPDNVRVGQESDEGTGRRPWKRYDLLKHLPMLRNIGFWPGLILLEAEKGDSIENLLEIARACETITIGLLPEDECKKYVGTEGLPNGMVRKIAEVGDGEWLLFMNCSNTYKCMEQPAPERMAFVLPKDEKELFGWLKGKKKSECTRIIYPYGETKEAMNTLVCVEAHAKSKRRGIYAVSVDDKGTLCLAPDAYQRDLLKDSGEGRILLEHKKIQKNYLLANPQLRRLIQSQIAEEALSASPATQEFLKKTADEQLPELSPFYQLAIHRRLGYLESVDELTCIKDWTQYGFKKAERYPLKITTVPQEQQFNKEVTRDGRLETVKFARVSRGIRIEINGPADTLAVSEQKKELQSLVDHFEIPEIRPVDVVFRAKYEQNLKEMQRMGLVPANGMLECVRCGATIPAESAVPLPAGGYAGRNCCNRWAAIG